MSSARTVDLFVDVAELDRVQRELITLITALEGIGDHATVHPDTQSMGSTQVADAVGRFVSGWETGRRRIVENLRACQQYAEMAAQHYTQAETALQGALAPATTDGSRAP